jgi:hypothetical protein
VARWMREFRGTTAILRKESLFFTSCPAPAGRASQHAPKGSSLIQIAKDQSKHARRRLFYLYGSVFNTPVGRHDLELRGIAP